MFFWKIALFLGCAVFLLGQEPDYSGPAILTRGQAASNVPTAEEGIRPFVMVNGIFDNALTAVSVNQKGEIPNIDAVGVEGQLGLYGHRSWKKTLLDLDYRGDYRHYSRQSYYDGSDQFLSLGLSHAFSKRLQLTVREGAGTYSRAYLLTGAGFFAPNLPGIPTNDLFDNRVIYLSTDAAITYQKSARLSFNFEGDGFLVRRQSSALYGVTGALARGDIAYRISRHTTVGADYEFNHMSFTKAVGGSDVHTAGLTIATRLSRFWEIGLYAGASRVDSLFLTPVPLAPTVAVLLGEVIGVQVGYRVHYTPAIRARLTRNFRAGAFQAIYTREVMAGNGIYLTTAGDTAMAGYTYSGIHHWNFMLSAGYNRMSPLVQNVSPYRAYLYGGGFTRLLAKDVHLVARLDFRRYEAGTLKFERVPFRAVLGFAWSPGDRPLSLW